MSHLTPHALLRIAIAAAAMPVAAGACGSRSSEPMRSAAAGAAGTGHDAAEEEVAATPRQATVREILAAAARAGELVRVTGSCAHSTTSFEVGAPPVSAGDWLLRSGDVAVFVSGPAPAGCPPDGAGKDPVTILARVVEDTLPIIGTMPAAPRRYLVRLDR